MSELWLKECESCDVQLLGHGLKEKSVLSIFLRAGWNVSVMAGAKAAILDYEVTI